MHPHENLYVKEALLDIVKPSDLKDGIDPATYYIATTDAERLDLAIKQSHFGGDSIDEMMENYGQIIADQAEQYANGEEVSDRTDTELEEIGKIFQNHYLAELVIHKRRRFARTGRFLAILASGLAVAGGAEAIHYADAGISKLNMPAKFVAKSVEQQETHADEVIILFGAVGAILYNLSDRPKRYARIKAQKALQKQLFSK
jgi:hypothetical protein